MWMFCVFISPKSERVDLGIDFGKVNNLVVLENLKTISKQSQQQE